MTDMNNAIDQATAIGETTYFAAYVNVLTGLQVDCIREIHSKALCSS